MSILAVPVGAGTVFLYLCDLIKVIIDLAEWIIKDVKASPYKKPDIARFRLVDSYALKYCIVPSIIKGTANTEMEYFITIKGEKISATICPNAIPVHLAHKGS